ncbi:MAG TPA: SRPBCC family protein [Gemmatimonadales bacterium]|jgi:uncharacterized protein YndB with AHSA1/START domain|nr:SRPBCC family protein [Gemmatimonadales bacterium]
MTAHTETTHDKASTDRIEKRVVLQAPRSRVWRAIANVEEFGAWFNARFEGEFTEGATVRGRITQPGYEHIELELQLVRIEPERYFAYRWHPGAIDPGVDYSAEPTTLVEFTLEDVDAGTAVTIVESGFDKIPLTRRAEAFRLNDRGWDAESKNLERYVA